MAHRTCSADDCGMPHVARGWCSRHYAQMRRAGVVLYSPCSVPECAESAVTRGMCHKHSHRRYMHETGRSKPLSTVGERFWRRVDKSGGPDACWPWSGRRIPQNYGILRNGGRSILATRWLLGDLRGEPLGEDEFALHHCDNPPCVNPVHLYAGTKAQNSKDMVDRGRHGRFNSTKTSCPYGHPYDEQNTKRKKNGWRECRTCDIARQRRLRERRAVERAANATTAIAV